MIKINKHPRHLYCVSISGSNGSNGSSGSSVGGVGGVGGSGSIGVYLRFIHDPLQSSQHDVQK